MMKVTEVKECKARANRTTVGFLIGLQTLVFLVGCSGPRVNPDDRNENRVLVRQWTLQTHGPFDIGEKGTEYSNPVLYENTLVFGNRSQGLTSIYPEMNRNRWNLPIDGGVVSELEVSRDRVYFGGGDGFLYAVLLDTGKVLWKYELRNPIVSRPVVYEGRVFVSTSDDAVFALDAGTGKWLWHYRRKSQGDSSVYGASPPRIDAGEVIVGMSDGYLLGLSLEEGQVNWEKRIHFGRRFTDVNAQAVIDSGRMIVPSYDGALYALDRKTREVDWKFEAGGSKEVILEGDRLYFPSSNGTVYCLDKKTGKLLWKFNFDRGVPTRLAMSDQHVFVGSSYQYFYTLNKETGELMSRFNVGYGSGFSGAPVYDLESERLYVLSGAGNLYAFAMRHRSPKSRPHGKTDPYTFELVDHNDSR